MVDRVKLIELLETVPHPQRLYPDLYVDNLIANGVKVQKHGLWEKPSKYGMAHKFNHLGVVCSACASWSDNLTAYCSHCGAKMEYRGEEDGK